jgi:primosomal protein N' (replication factor Y)
MHCIVRIFNGLDRPLTYGVPQEWRAEAALGKIVHVPLLQRTERGIIVEIQSSSETYPYKIRDLYSIEPMPHDAHYYRWIEQVSAYYATEPWKLYQRFFSFKTIRQKKAVEAIEHNQKDSWQLTAEQADIVERLECFILNPCYRPALLHGVTGSGKTLVYHALLQKTISAGKTALLLLPEVSLAMTLAQTLRALSKTGVEVYEYHYAISAMQKNALWSAIIAEKPIIIVGVRLPIFLPLANLGLVIIDEEHDAGFQDSSHPRINTKEVALLRAQQYKIPILLGSATPSLSSLYLAQQRSWDFFQLLQRFSGSFPRITHAPLLIPRKKNAIEPPDSFWISTALREAISSRLARKEQTIIFINRRGLYRFIQCIDCTSIVHCNACSVSLTLHAKDKLYCHYCGLKQSVPAHCPTCGTTTPFLKKGIGTQRIAEVLHSLFPLARISRADIDSKKEQKGWSATVTAMQEGLIDILVGTQMITKGYHFPRVTLVGIVWAESNLSLPFYTAVESTLQQLLQVAGRAGRESSSSEVIVQSYIRHPLFAYLNECNYQKFYTYELTQRQQPCYPPFIRLSEIELQHTDEERLQNDSHHIWSCVRDLIKKHEWDVQLLGPAMPPVHRINHTSFRRIYIKGGNIEWHLALFHHAKNLLSTDTKSSRMFFTPNPLQ